MKPSRLLHYFESLHDPFRDDGVETPPKQFWAFCWFYCRPLWPLLVIAALLSGVVAMLEITIFTFMGDLVTLLTNASRDGFFEDHGATLIWMTVVLMLLLPIAQFVRELFLNQGIAGNFPMGVRWRGHRYLLRQSLSFYQNDFAGRIANTLMQTSLAVREVMIKVGDVFVFVGVYFIGAVAVVAYADWRLTLPFFGWFIGYAFLLVHFIPKLRDIAKRQAEARSVMTGHVVDAYSNIQTVKLFSHAEREERFAKISMKAFMETVYVQMRRVTWLNLSLALLNNTAFFAIAGTSIWAWWVNVVSIGDIALAMGLVLRLHGMSHWILWEMAGIFENVGTVQDGISTLTLARVVRDQPNARTLVIDKGAISFDHVRFHYGREKSVIEDLSLDISAGEKVGIVGPSGAGKSTLVNLLLRLYDVEAGAIRIDGQNIAEVTQESLRSRIGMVSQDTSLLHRSVRDNIAYGREGASDAEIIAAAEKANAWSFIPGLEDVSGRRGLDALVGERGVNLSGGQRQRVAIARVLLKDAPILVLDEATSALDSGGEAAIQEQLKTLMEGKTVIAIAHRLSTIAEMDRLIVLNQGRIVEMGTHAELVAEKGHYAELWARQSGGFLYGAPRPLAAE
ncbi:MAG: ABC transporter ATP-binding protein [Rhizobiales bacterium]|nr:ABC transporter ATP-binding protein [Hyphomicrobiales bacterium]